MQDYNLNNPHKVNIDIKKNIYQTLVYHINPLNHVFFLLNSAFTALNLTFFLQ